MGTPVISSKVGLNYDVLVVVTSGADAAVRVFINWEKARQAGKKYNGRVRKCEVDLKSTRDGCMCGLNKHDEHTNTQSEMTCNDGDASFEAEGDNIIRLAQQLKLLSNSLDTLIDSMKRKLEELRTWSKSVATEQLSVPKTKSTPRCPACKAPTIYQVFHRFVMDPKPKVEWYACTRCGWCSLL